VLTILGANGQVGRALTGVARQNRIPHRALGRAQCDIADPTALQHAIAGSSFVVNCAAYTAVDRAETDVDAACRVNALGAENVAVACAQAGIPLVHISTDYVFDGIRARPAREDDRPRPLSVYGSSKLAGEEKVRQHLPFHVILRTSWIFSEHGENFVKTILRLSRSQSELRVVDDQVGCPTAADDLADAILQVTRICREPRFSNWGTYHFTGAPAVSWCDFARAIVADRNIRIVPAATKDVPRAARRPANSVLDCNRIMQVFGIRQPDWRVSLAGVRGAIAGAALDADRAESEREPSRKTR
jgi:dTDP-4-dehydrorhamnose reductase